MGPDSIAMPLPEYLGLLEAQGFNRFVVLHRFHYLRMNVSRAAGFLTKTWHTTAASDEPPKLTISTDHMEWGAWRGTLLERLRNLDTQHAQLLQLLEGKRVLHLNYEEHISNDPTVAYQALCNFLDVPATPVSVRLRKTNPFPLHQSVNNWDEVVDALSGTEYAWMLTQEQPPATT